MKRFALTILSIILLFSFVGCENYLNERQLSHRKFKGEYIPIVNYLNIDIEGYEYENDFVPFECDKIENGKAYYIMREYIDFENWKDNYEERETVVIDQVLYEEIIKVVESVGRKLIYEEDGIIFASGEKFVFGEQRSSNETGTRGEVDVDCKDCGLSFRLYKNFIPYLDCRYKVLGRNIVFSFTKALSDSLGQTKSVFFSFKFRHSGYKEIF